MQNTSADYKLEINKPSRSFDCKVTIGNNIYTNEDIVDVILDYPQSTDGFTIGNTISQTLDLTLINRADIIYSTSQVKVEIGLKIGSKIEYVLMGYYNIDDIEKTDYTTKIICYDDMIKFETPYFSELSDKPTLQQVVNELVKITGIQFEGSLPAYTVSKLEGFSCREVLSYVASICAGNALITRTGKFTIKVLSEVSKTINGDNYFDFKREEVKYKVGKITCQVNENSTLSKGSLGTNSMELSFENPWITEKILTELYNKLNGLSYLGYSMKWQGDLSLDPYDIITVTDTKNVTRKIPLLSQKFTYTGGLTSEIEAKGESKNKNYFSSSGSTTNKVNRLVTEQAIIKEALIDKANIKDLEAVSIKTQTLEAKTAKIEEAIIDVAHIEDLNAINANIENLKAEDATINNALIGKADITQLNAVQGNINTLNSQVANIETLVNGNLTSDNIQSLVLSSSKVTVENGFIKNAMIENLDVSKINAGTISTDKFLIKSADGGIEINGATQQFKDKNNKVRLQLGKDSQGNFNFILRGEDGTSVLLDHTGLKAKAIADGLIVNDMLGQGAVTGDKVNIGSLIQEVNKDANTSTIKATKIQLDKEGQSLDIAFNSLKNIIIDQGESIETNSTNISLQQGKIEALISDTSIVEDGSTKKLKDAYANLKLTVNGLNSTIGSHTTNITNLQGQMSTANSNISNLSGKVQTVESKQVNFEQNLNGISQKVSSSESNITTLQGQMTTANNNINANKSKIDGLEIGGINLLVQKNVTKGKYLNNQGTTVDNSEWFYSDYIPVSGIKKLVVSGYSNLGQAPATCYYDSNKNLVKGISNNGQSLSKDITIDSGIAYIRFSGMIRDLATLKIEKGTKSTSYSQSPQDTENAINDVDVKVTTTNNKVVSLETNLNGISSKVTSVENSVVNINGNITSLQNRVSTAEQEITSNRIIAKVTEALGNGKNITTVSWTLDKTGVTIKNGAIRVQNNAGQTVLSGDSSGNLWVQNTLSVGGNTNGAVLVKNSSGTPIFSANKNGTFVKDGTMTISSGNITTSGTGYPDGEIKETKHYAYGMTTSYTGASGSQVSKYYGKFHYNACVIEQDNSGNASGTSYKSFLGPQSLSFQSRQGTGGWSTTSVFSKSGVTLPIGGQVAWSVSGDAAKIYAEQNSSDNSTSLCVETADDGDQDCFRIRNNHWQNGRKDVAVFQRDWIYMNSPIYDLILGKTLKIDATHPYVDFRSPTSTRRGYIGFGAGTEEPLYIVSDVNPTVLVKSHLCPINTKTYWVGTNSPDRKWKGLCAEGGTVGASDIRSKENIERLDGTIVAYDELNDEIQEYQLLNFRNKFDRAIPTDYYDFIKDRFKPSYYNYKLSDSLTSDGDFSIDPNAEYDMLKNIGFIAQDYDLETDAVAREFIFADEEGNLSYNHMSYVTVGMIALQEAIKKIEMLENRIKTLESS